MLFIEKARTSLCPTRLLITFCKIIGLTFFYVRLFYYIYTVINNKMKVQNTFKYYQDPGHGWIAVKVELLEQLGINGQISVASENLSLLRHALDTIVFLEGCRLNVAIEDDGKSFLKLKVKVREKIVADGLTDFEFDGTGGGVHLDAKDWNALAKSEDAIIIDMRNHYETEVGRFEKAVLPDADTFRELLPMVENEFGDAKDRTVMMYCTGGIRCEKASAYLKAKGFSKVHQLNGGIIEYARQVREQGLDNRFKGKNFVFDERLGERISDDVIAHCHQCGAPCDDHTNCKNKGRNLLFIQCSACADKMQGCCCTECVTVYNMSEDEQRAYRKKQREAGVRYQKGRIRPRLTEAGESA